MNLFNGSTFGLWVPFLPLAILSPSSLQKGIRIFHSPDRDLSSTPESVSEKCYSRIGLIGNPSDGYYGKTISIAISNFFTEVTLLKSSTLRIIPNPTFQLLFPLITRSDPTLFTSFSDLHHILSKNGYTVPLPPPPHNLGRHSPSVRLAQSLLQVPDEKGDICQPVSLYHEAVKLPPSHN